MWLYALIAVLLLIAIAMQVYFLRTYAAQVTKSAKIVMGLNIGLLVALLLAVLWLARSRGVG